ncbi:MAG: phage Gp37/Gp68 family protein [Ancalomicrobiaceae bacterium]|nr:phage Gp37/Gp68 family protein [Ancalomicrobiaceae bacterium]
MADGTKIEWTDMTWTPIRARHIELQNDGSGKLRLGWHCERVSEGCRNCYAEGINRRLGTGLDFKPGNLFRSERDGPADGAALFLDDRILTEPLRKRAARMIFVCSMTDLFAHFVPREWIDWIFAIIALSPQHTFQVLTKRPARMREYLSSPATWHRIYEIVCDLAVNEIAKVLLIGQEGPYADPTFAPHRQRVHLGNWPLPNVWLGVSVEDQPRADARIPILLDTPAAIRWISTEPLLGMLNVLPYLFIYTHTDHAVLTGDGDLSEPLPYRDPATTKPEDIASPRLDWVVCGGESGPNARPMHPDWARSLRDQCAMADVPFLLKQWGSWFSVLDRDNDDPDWRANYSRHKRGGNRVLNLAGGCGFHGERVHIMQRMSKTAAGRTLDGVTHDAYPEVPLHA